MGKRKDGRTSKSAAIRSALDQLGWHANAKDVAALLANYGNDVDEGLVHKVKLENLKGSTGVRSRKVLVKQRQNRPKLPRVRARRIPAQRTYQR
jgi:hypothetical protein